MTSPIGEGSGVLYMKIGTHAQEPLEEIIRRKTKEIEDAGFALWGYGGNTCHPTTMVQPFARQYERRGGVIYLCMQRMDSTHFAVPERAKEYSVDGETWVTIPPTINVLGSRYALAISDLHEEEFDLPLARTRVALGNSMGRPGSQYISGRVDKACLELSGAQPGDDTASVVHIGVVATIVEPFGVFVRN
jgi:hypothetical protein